MCDSRWSEIKPSEITSKTMSKQMMALLNQKKKAESWLNVQQVKTDELVLIH